MVKKGKGVYKNHRDYKTMRYLLPENPRECRNMIKPMVRFTVHQNCYLCKSLLSCYKHDKITPYVEQKIIEITKAIR